jgi:predicted O-methyltransferase YrrM
MNSEKPQLKDALIGEEISSIDTIVDGFKTYQVVRAALEMGLFEWLDSHGPASREELVKALSMKGMFSRSFFQTLAEQGLIIAEKGRDGRISNSGLTSRLLVQKSPTYQGNWILHIADAQSEWNSLKNALVEPAGNNTGIPIVMTPGLLKALGERSLRGELQKVTKIISEWEDFSAAKKLLDIGGAHGLYAIAACQQNPHLQAVVFDKSEITGMTKEYIRAYGMEDRISVVGGDILQDNPGENYDIVIVSHLLYQFRRDLPPIFEKVASTLNPKGLFISNHWFCGPVCGEGSMGIRELDLAFHSGGHPLCHPEKIAEEMAKKGLFVTKKTSAPSNFGISHIHVAEKKQQGGCSPISDEKESCGCHSCH